MSSPLTLFPRLVAVVLAFVVVSAVSSAADAVRLPAETVVARGSIVSIPVTGTLSIPGTVRIVMTYPANIIRIRRVVGGDAYLFKCGSVQVISDSLLTGSTGQITLQCSDVVTGADSRMFDLVVEGLFNPESTGQIQPLSLTANGNDSSDVEFIPGIATLEGESPIRPTEKEGITGNYPNPFNAASRFVFTMKQAETVSLVIRNLQGRVVKDLGNVDARAGENSYLFEPEAYELSQGTYIMQLSTSSSVYLHSFMVLR